MSASTDKKLFGRFVTRRTREYTGVMWMKHHHQIVVVVVVVVVVDVDMQENIVISETHQKPTSF